ncbi:MAG: sulfotransferase [Desulfuromonadales bacterium]|nr:sulfotransferase [Desulfuromonadales bacterium]
MGASSDSRPIFIVGAPRSGTTLLQYMLRSHSKLSFPTGESHFIVPLFRKAESFGDLSQKNNIRRVLDEMYRRNADFLLTDLHGMRFEAETLADELHSKGCDTIPKIIAGLFEKNARGEGKKRWGDKTPYYVLHLPTILEMFPNAQIIHLIRDGRDCALSLLGRRFDFNVYNFYYAAAYWKHYVDIGQKSGRQLDSGTYMGVRYEDLLTVPVVTMKKICGFLEENYSETVVNFNKSTEPGKTPLLQKPVQKQNAGKWKKIMRPDQIKIFESAAKDTLIRNGYSLVTEPEPLPLFLSLAYRAHNKVFTKARNFAGKYIKK